MAYPSSQSRRTPPPYHHAATHQLWRGRAHWQLWWPVELIKPDSLSTRIWAYRFAGLQLHPLVALVAFLGPVHLRIPFPIFVFGGAGRRDQDGIHDPALPHRHAQYTEVGFNGF